MQRKPTRLFVVFSIVSHEVPSATVVNATDKEEATRQVMGNPVHANRQITGVQEVNAVVLLNMDCVMIMGGEDRFEKMA